LHEIFRETQSWIGRNIGEIRFLHFPDRINASLPWINKFDLSFQQVGNDVLVRCAAEVSHVKTLFAGIGGAVFGPRLNLGVGSGMLAGICGEYLTAKHLMNEKLRDYLEFISQFEHV
jgi:hypothetical protein